jgi:hypothetical protein
LATLTFKRALVGSSLVLFWIVIFAVHDLPLSTQGWAWLVPLRCPLSFLFDVQCPTCGLGRSLVAAALGHVLESYRYHPLGLPLFWGCQALLLCWMFWPRGWEAVRRLRQKIGRNQPVLWSLIVFYTLWGFCWRAPL